LSLFDSILFDFDGVLADSEGVHYQCWISILEPLGIPLSWEAYCANCIGITDRAMLEALARQKNPPHDVEDLWQYYPKKKALFREKAYANPPIPEATRALVRSLSQYSLAVVSSSLCSPPHRPLMPPKRSSKPQVTRAGASHRHCGEQG
jgi:beta-phosphoglucomutase